MSISKVSQAVPFLAIIIAIWTASVLGAEAYFRALGDAPSAAMGGLYIQFGSDNFKLAPSIDTQASLYVGTVSVHTDGLGLRCDSARRFAVHSGDSLDVLLVGDSQGFGNGVDFENSLSGTVIQGLARRGYRAANSSVGGHHLGSQFELVTWLVEDQHVKVSHFVLMLTPALIGSDDEYNHATVGKDGRLYGKGRENSTLYGRVRLWSQTHLVAYGRVRDALRNLGLEPSADNDEIFQLYQTRDRAADPLFQDQVRRLKEFARLHGATVDLVYVPFVNEVDFGAIQRAAAKAGRVIDVEAPWRTVSSVAATLQLPLYDLRPPLRKARAAGYGLKVKADFHYSAQLSELSGSALAAELQLPPTSSKEQVTTARK